VTKPKKDTPPGQKKKQEVTSGVLVHMRHIRAARLCGRGTREWFAFHGIDMLRLKEGVPVEEIEATGDKMALEVAAIARADHGS
jgi:hypothetical protein